MSLLEAAKKKELTVKDISCCGVSKQRLMDLGIFKGTRLTVLGSAPLGDPIIIEVDNTIIAIRKTDAKNIIVA